MPLKQPTPAQVKRAREFFKLSREQAAELVYATYRTWQNWELEDSPEAREIPLASWELFLRKCLPRKQDGMEKLAFGMELFGKWAQRVMLELEGRSP